MWDFNLLAATRTIETSMPFVVYRLLICLGAALGFLLATLAGAGTFVGFGSLARNALALGPFGAVAGFAVFGFLMYKIRPVWLHVVKAPQLALIADQAKGTALPTGKALIEYAKRRQMECFPSTSALFELDQHIQDTLKDIAAFRPLGLIKLDHPQARKYLTEAEKRLSALNHQTLLAWHFYSGSDNPWRTATQGLALVDRHFAALTRNRLTITVFSWMGFLAAYPLLLAGIQGLVSGIPVNLSFWPYVFAGVFAWALKAAFFDAIAEAAMTQCFFPLASQEAGVAPSAELEQRSVAFRHIQQKAGEMLIGEIPTIDKADKP